MDDESRIAELELRVEVLELALKFVIAALPETQQSRLEALGKELAARIALEPGEPAPPAMWVADLLRGGDEDDADARLDAASALQRPVPRA